VLLAEDPIDLHTIVGILDDQAEHDQQNSRR